MILEIEKVSLVIDRSSPLPLYYQLRQILLKQIRDGHIRPGQPIPSEAGLQEQYGVSQITVRRAVSGLASEGYLLRQPGKGTFVLPPKLQDRSGRLGGFAADLASRGFKVDSVIVEYGVQPIPPHVARALKLETGHPLLFFRRMIFADDEPIALTTAHCRLGEGITFTKEELGSDSIFPLFERKYGIRLLHAERTIEAVVLRPDEAESLEARPGTPALLSRLTAFDSHNRPIVFARTVYRGDRYRHYCPVSQ